MPIIFRYDDYYSGAEPWVTDGIYSRTGFLRDTHEGIGDSSGNGFDYGHTVTDGTLFPGGPGGQDIWWTDGTAGNTVEIAAGFGNELGFSSAGGIEFGGDYISGGTWSGDPTAPGGDTIHSGIIRFSRDDGWTVLYDVEADTNPRQLIDLDDAFIFLDDIPGQSNSSVNFSYGWSLFVSDGTPGGTAEVPSPLSADYSRFDADITLLPESTNGTTVFYTAVADDDIIVDADNPARYRTDGGSLFVTDGTFGGTARIAQAGTLDPRTVEVAVGETRTFLRFEAQDRGGYDDPLSESWQMWSSDGTAAGTALLADASLLYPGTPGNTGTPWALGMSEPITVGDEVAFITTYRQNTMVDGSLVGTIGADIHISTGGGQTLGTSVAIPAAIASGISADEGDFFHFDGNIIFESGYGLYATDLDTGTTAQIHQFEISPQNTGLFRDAPFFDLGHHLVFLSGGTSQTNRTLWSWDGTAGQAEYQDEVSTNTQSFNGERKTDSYILQDGDRVYYINESSSDLHYTFVNVEKELGTREIFLGNGSVSILGRVPFADHGLRPVLGTAGDDSLSGLTYDQLFIGLEGRDHLRGSLGNDIMRGGPGNDILRGGHGVDTADYSDAPGGVQVYLNWRLSRGAEGYDRLYQMENLLGSAFDDRLVGDEGDNEIRGGAGDDIIKGKGGNDTFFGEDGNDRLRGERWVDTFHGGAGDDILLGLGGNDWLFGEDGVDYIYGGRDNDYIEGGDGGDFLRGNLGRDGILGQAGDDDIRGGGMDDHLVGGAGNDFLLGEGGSDRLEGGAGDDVLSGGFGAGVNDGQRDTFVFAPAGSGAGGFDRIRDFENGVDRIDLTAFGFTDFASEVAVLASSAAGGTAVRIDFGDGDVLYLEDFTTGMFDASDVILG